jgi:hypothetical protein
MKNSLDLDENDLEYYYSLDLDENDIISYRLNKEAEDEIHQLTGTFRSCVMKIIYCETGVLHDRTPRGEKGLKLKITMLVVHQSSMSSNSCSHP